MYPLTLPNSRGSRSSSQVCEARGNNILAWQADMAIKEVAVLTDPRTGKERAKWKKKASYLSLANRCPSSSQNTSMETHNRPWMIATQRPSRCDARGRKGWDRREAVACAAVAAVAIEDVQPKTHQGGSKPPTTRFQQYGGVQMMRSGVTMASATAGTCASHKHEQYLLLVGAQFEDDGLEDSEWVFL